MRKKRIFFITLYFNRLGCREAIHPVLKQAVFQPFRERQGQPSLTFFRTSPKEKRRARNKKGWALNHEGWLNLNVT